MYTVIDSDDYPAAGIERLIFPGGEPHVKVPSIAGDILFFAKLCTWNDVGFAACVWDTLQRRLKEKDKVTMFCPYFPGARQDKTDGTAPITLNLVGNLLWSLGGKVVAFDIHNEEKANIYTDVFANLMPTRLKIPIYNDVVGIIAPDKGAIERARDFRNKFYPKAGLLCASKIRNQATGALSDYVLPSPAEVGRYIIVDDICDGGGTFNLLAKEFFDSDIGKKSKLELFVSHGIFSKGLSAIDARIEHITTTDSWCPPDLEIRYPERLTIIPLKSLFDTVMEI